MGNELFYKVNKCIIDEYDFNQKELFKEYKNI